MLEVRHRRRYWRVEPPRARGFAGNRRPDEAHLRYVRRVDL